MDEVTTRGKRPFGLYAIIILQMITAINFVARSVWSPHDVLPLLLSSFTDPRILNTLTVVGILLLLTNIAGLWWLQRWAWVATMILAGISLLFGIILYFEGTPPYLQMVTNLFIVLYLNQRSVQNCFERRGTAPVAG